MIVCSCNRTTDHHLRATIAAAPAPISNAAALYRAAGCTPQCGRCADSLRAILAEPRAKPCTGTVCCAHASARDREAA